jgi:hypothetical protein
VSADPDSDFPPRPLPWYRQFWPWFLVILPLVVIMACLYTVFLAVDHPLSLVKKDYYREGLAINRDHQRYQRAEELELAASVRLDGDRIVCDLKIDAQDYPPVLQLQFFHPVDSEKDIQLSLLLTEKPVYQTKPLDPTLLQALTREKRWYIYLEPGGASANYSWALRTDSAMDGTRPVTLGWPDG